MSTANSGGFTSLIVRARDARLHDARRLDDATAVVPVKTQRLVLMLMVSYASSDGRRMFAAKSTLAKRAGCNEKTVYNAIRALRAQGVITNDKWREGDPQHLETVQSNWYRFVYDAAERDELAAAETASQRAAYASRRLHEASPIALHNGDETALVRLAQATRAVSDAGFMADVERLSDAIRTNVAQGGDPSGKALKILEGMLRQRREAEARAAVMTS